jgi:tetratricopeptide (TPR) repeat protein
MRCGGCCYGLLIAGFLSFVFAVSVAQEPDSTAVDDEWLNTVWSQVDDMVQEEEYELQEVVTVAGVRGAEAEDNILDKLYYKGGKRAPSQSKLLKAIETLEKAIEKDPKGKDVPKQKYFIGQCYEKLGRINDSKKFYRDIVDNHKESSYNKKALFKLQ